MRFALGILAALLVGLAIGGASALILAGIWPRGAPMANSSTVDVDGWRSDFAVGSEAADPYTRARVARHGLLALAKSEAVYFTRSTDDRGKQLREECIYELSGEGQPARWWSITLYDGDSRDRRVLTNRPFVLRHFAGADGAHWIQVAPKGSKKKAEAIWLHLEGEAAPEDAQKLKDFRVDLPAYTSRAAAAELIACLEREHLLHS